MKRNTIIANLSKINRKVNQYIHENLQAKGIHGIVSSHGAILSLLFDKGSLTLTDISRAIDREKNTTTILVRKLEENGYVHRHEHPKDGRKKVITLTKKGLGIEESFLEISNLAIERVYRDIDESEESLLLSCLDKVLDNVYKGV
jgi:DNA-binding MarR family transcriptional regulator